MVVPPSSLSNGSLKFFWSRSSLSLAAFSFLSFSFYARSSYWSSSNDLSMSALANNEASWNSLSYSVVDIWVKSIGASALDFVWSCYELLDYEACAHFFVFSSSSEGSASYLFFTYKFVLFSISTLFCAGGLLCTEGLLDSSAPP